MADNSVPQIDGFSDLVQIGRGGFSTVYSATQAGIERRVAIKILDLGFSDERRFERECRTLGALSGVRGIVPVLQAAFTTTGQPCIVMQLMDGGSLAYRVRSKGPLGPGDTISNGIVLCTALQAAHDARVFHRDIKPENVLFHGTEAAVADFGIALIADIESRSQTMESLSPPHAPPERFIDGSTDPVLGDIYSLGSTLYTALAGAPPFGTPADGGLAGLIMRVTTAPLPPIERTDLPAGLIDALSVATAKEPTHRFQSMASFGRALESIDLSDVADDGGLPRSPLATTVVRPAAPVAPLVSLPPLLPPPPARAATPPPPASADAPSTGPHTDPGVQPQSDASRSSRLLWAIAAVLLVASLAGGGVLAVSNIVEDDGASGGSGPTTRLVATTSTTTTSTTTTSTTTTVPTSTTSTAPRTTAPPQVSGATISAATTAVDLYLSAASGFDTDAFVDQWRYPIEKYYNNPASDEATVRRQSEDYFADHQDLDFRRRGPTDVVASGSGWETVTMYRAYVKDNAGVERCEINRISLGFDTSWYVRTAEEEKISAC